MRWHLGFSIHLTHPLIGICMRIFCTPLIYLLLFLLFMLPTLLHCERRRRSALRICLLGRLYQHCNESCRPPRPLQNFVHLSRFLRARNEPMLGPSSSSKVAMRESTVVESNETPMVGSKSRFSHAAVKRTAQDF
ncbi:Uncharacterized protein Fot_12620 [Forsythia ovata]|uniref:Secreted protein n=1 Tax=Forsythia ovata TaxID=205694 RepID=A0ABD1WS09_9LAMI